MIRLDFDIFQKRNGFIRKKSVPWKKRGKNFQIERNKKI